MDQRLTSSNDEIPLPCDQTNIKHKKPSKKRKEAKKRAEKEQKEEKIKIERKEVTVSFE
jgi:hypothetical protein